MALSGVRWKTEQSVELMNNFPEEQPSVGGVVERMSHDLSAKAVLLLHENGQILHNSGWIEDADYPSIAALVVAMIAAGKSLGSLGEVFPGSPSRFSCDSENTGFYTVGVSQGIWLAVLYDLPLNPGLFRMKVRRYAELLAQLGVRQPEQWESTEISFRTGASLPPVSKEGIKNREILTKKDSTLFVNITDEEIDQIFENPSS